MLASTTAPLTGARIHRLTGRSYPQVHHVLGRLVDHGLVGAEEHGNPRSYWLNREHVAAEHLVAIAARALRVDAEHVEREAQRYRLEHDVERWTGNRCQVIELTRTDLVWAVDAQEALVDHLRPRWGLPDRSGDE